MSTQVDKVKYPDTNQGAFDCLKAVSCINDENLEVDAWVALADPAVEGVWKLFVQFIDGKRWVVVLQMAGYPDPFGDIRETTDFDELDPDTEWVGSIKPPKGVYPPELKGLKSQPSNKLLMVSGREREWERLVEAIWLNDGTMQFWHDMDDEGKPVLRAVYTWLKPNLGSGPFEVGVYYKGQDWGYITDPRLNTEQFEAVRSVN